MPQGISPIEISYNVNDPNLRVEFLTKILPQAIRSLEKTTEAEWGEMTAQHMVEHLMWAFRMSTDKMEVECKTPPEKLDRMQAFLNMNRPMPKGYVNPVTGKQLPNQYFQNLERAKKALAEEVEHYLLYYKNNPKATHTNPTFGELDAEGWQKFHFKHCFHHLSQFGLICEQADAQN